MSASARASMSTAAAAPAAARSFSNGSPNMAMRSATSAAVGRGLSGPKSAQTSRIFAASTSRSFVSAVARDASVGTSGSSRSIVASRRMVMNTRLASRSSRSSCASSSSSFVVVGGATAQTAPSS